MGDFDLVLRGALVSPETVIEDGWVASRNGKVAATGIGAPPAGRRCTSTNRSWFIRTA